VTEVGSIKKVPDQYARTLCPPNTRATNKCMFAESKTNRNLINKCQKVEEKSPDDIENAEMFKNNAEHIGSIYA